MPDRTCSVTGSKSRHSPHTRRQSHGHSSSRPLYWAVGSSGSAHGGDRRRFPLRLKHYSDAGYINLLTPLALLPAATHARRRLRALVIGGGAGEV